MVPESLLRYSPRDGQAVPLYLGPADHPWLRALIDVYERFVGEPRRALEERLKEPLPVPAPGRAVRLAAAILDRLHGGAVTSAVPPREARSAVFGEAARGGEARDVMERVARSLGVDVPDLAESLFADLPGERRLGAPGEALGPEEVALRANLAMVQGFLYRSTSVAIEAVGQARALVRHAKLRGLICTVSRGAEMGVARLDVSGPFALFRRTLLYGRALAEVVPRLAWCERFRLTSEVVLRGEALRFVVCTGDPIFPSGEPRRYDSRLEERFAKEFARIAPAWDLVREPEPIEAGGTLIFPDFALVHRHDPSRRWLLEIVGFWTPGYLERKLARLREAGLGNLIIGVDEERNCGEADLPAGAPVVRFRRRVDPAAVLRIVDPEASPAAPCAAKRRGTSARSPRTGSRRP